MLTKQQSIPALCILICIIMNGGFCSKKRLLTLNNNDNELSLVQLQSMVLSCNSTIAKLHDLLDLKIREINATTQDAHKKEIDRISNLEAKVHTTMQHMVGFTACHRHGSTIGVKQTVIYDHIITNIGKAYDVTDGEFTVPYNGLYTFSVTGMAFHNTDMYLTLVKNGGGIHTIYSNEGNADSSTTTVNVYLQAGDKVWVANSGPSADQLHPYDYNCFSGMLVKEG